MDNAEEGQITTMEDDQPKRAKIIWIIIAVIAAVGLVSGGWFINRWFKNQKPIAEDSYLGSLLNPPKTVHRAEDVQIKADIVQIQSMLEIYRSQNSSYPQSSTSPEPIDRILSIIENRSGATVSSGDLLYATDLSGNYYIFAQLSNKSDPQLTTQGPPSIAMPTGYNYWVTNK